QQLRLSVGGNPLASLAVHLRSFHLRSFHLRSFAASVDKPPLRWLANRSSRADRKAHLRAARYGGQPSHESRAKVGQPSHESRAKVGSPTVARSLDRRAKVGPTRIRTWNQPIMSRRL